MPFKRRYSLFQDSRSLSFSKQMGQTKDLQASKSKIPFKSTAEIDAHIKYVGCVFSNTENFLADALVEI